MSRTTEAKDKICTDIEYLKLQTFFDVGLTKFKQNQILLNKVIQYFSNDNQDLNWVKLPYYSTLFITAIKKCDGSFT